MIEARYGAPRLPEEYLAELRRPCFGGLACISIDHAADCETWANIRRRHVVYRREDDGVWLIVWVARPVVARPPRPETVAQRRAAERHRAEAAERHARYQAEMARREEEVFAKAEAERIEAELAAAQREAERVLAERIDRLGAEALARRRPCGDVIYEPEWGKRSWWDYADHLRAVVANEGVVRGELLSQG